MASAIAGLFGAGDAAASVGATDLAAAGFTDAAGVAAGAGGSLALGGAAAGAGAGGILGSGISSSAAVLGGANIASGIIGADAATSAAQTQANAFQQAGNTQLGLFNQTRADLLPYNATGQTALNQLATLYGLTPPGGGGTAGGFNGAAATTALSQYPGFQFALDTGSKAVAQNQNASSPGGNALTALTQYGQGLATSNVWAPYITQLNSMAGLGESAASQTGNFATATGGNVGGNIAGAGTALASGIAGSTNAITGNIGGGINNQLLLAALNGSSFGK